MGFAGEAYLETGAGDARLAECGGGRLGNFDGAIEEVFAGGEELKMMADVVRGIRVEAEVTVEEKEIGVVVVLAAAETRLAG